MSPRCRLRPPGETLLPLKAEPAGYLGSASCRRNALLSTAANRTPARSTPDLFMRRFAGETFDPKRRGKEATWARWKAG